MAEPFLAPGIAWMLVVLFSVLWIALGIWWGRQGKGDADDFMLAGRNIGLALSTATLMASWVTGNTTLLAPEFGYRNGLWGMFSYALAGLGLILFAPLALRIKDLMPSARTSGDFIRLRYGRAAWWVFMVITAIYTLGFLITQAMGAGILLEALSGFDYRLGMVVVIGVSTIYTLFGGMRAVVGTDFIQSLLIMVLLLVVAALAYMRFPSSDVHQALIASHPQRLNLLLASGPTDRLELRPVFDGRGVSQQHLVVAGVCLAPHGGVPLVRVGRLGLDDDPDRHRIDRLVGPGQQARGAPGEHGLPGDDGAIAGGRRRRLGVHRGLRFAHLNAGFPAGLHR